MRLIDADALKDEIAVLFERNPNLIDEWLSYQVEDAIDDASTIEERKKGKWEEREVVSEKVIDEWQSARCSVCGKYHTTPYMYYFDNFSFCPNCGARMVNDEDRSD